MRRALVVAALLWPVVLSAAVEARLHDRAPVASAVIYAAASRVCHQRPDRSFVTGGVQWPVCGRCAGLYLAAPIGALLALRRARAGGPATSRVRAGLAIAAAPTLATLVLEWTGAVAMTNTWRAVAALPLGAAVAWVLVTVAPRTAAANRVH